MKCLFLISINSLTNDNAASVGVAILSNGNATYGTKHLQNKNDQLQCFFERALLLYTPLPPPPPQIINLSKSKTLKLAQSLFPRSLAYKKG